MSLPSSFLLEVILLEDVLPGTSSTSCFPDGFVE